MEVFFFVKCLKFLNFYLVIPHPPSYASPITS